MSDALRQLWPIPQTWRWVTMGDISTVIGGGTPATNDPSNFGGAIPWITPADLTHYTERRIRQGARSISEKGLANSGARWLPEGSVLFSSRAPIGYTAIAAQNLTTNQGFKSFALYAGVFPDYVYHWLFSSKQLAESMASGTTFLELSGAKASQIPMPLPPSREQDRIVAKLDELLSDLDAGVAELKAAQQKLQRYRQSLLKAAVEGALTAEWRQKNPPTETGAELLQRILRERRAHWEEQQLAKFAAQGKAPPKGWKDKYPEPQPPKTEGLPELPEGWVWASVEQATAEALIGLDRGAEHQCKGGSGTLYLKMNNITLDGSILLDDLVRVDASASEIERFAALPGDILFNTRNSKELVGKAGLVQPHAEALIFNNNLMRLRFVDAVTPSFGISTLCSPAFRVRMEGIKKATTSVAAVYARDLWPLAIAIPPLTEQRLICSLLEDQLQAIDQQEALIRRMTRGLDAQRQNILRAAFRGELVPQDPNDEPASVLLARLRAERSGTKPAKTERKARKAKGAA